MKEKQQLLASYIDRHTNEATSFLQQLVQQPSVQGNERGVQDLVIQKLSELQLQVDVWDPGMEELMKHPYFVASRVNYIGSPNVVGVLRGQGGGKSIILNGHIDVVPEGDATKWNQHPFSGYIEGNKMYGRGTTDMKGGNVALLLAMEAIIKTGIKLKGDVIFESVIEEESGGVGTLATLIRGYKADAAIIPEPTNMKLFIKQQGSMWFRVVVEGRSAHGGTRYEGVSAIDKAWKIYEAIMKLEATRNAAIKDPLYKHVSIPLPINVGKIQGGSWPSSVPDLVTLEGRIGVGPHEAMNEVKQQLFACIKKANDQDDWLREHPAQLEFFGAQWVPNYMERDHPFVTELINNFQSVYNREIAIEASPWGTDGGLLGTVGGIPTLIIGPGETKVAHYPNEFIDLNEVMKAAKLFANTILSWCEPA
ncbi:MAG: peptidase [Cyclobacteriaceae bacterium]|nr:peptidase [Cyclobacteriaceae bacterium]